VLQRASPASTRRSCQTLGVMEPHDLLESVVDEASFLAFVAALLRDLRTNGETWQNGSIEDYLESALAWGEATNIGTTQGLANANAWRRAATLLYCGKIYE
jgi:hypothetical protein